MSDEVHAVGSKWGSLRLNQLATFFPVQHDGQGGWIGVDDSPVVRGPITDSTLEISLGWTSPFEAVGGAHIAPILQGLLQSGAGRSTVSLLEYLVPPEFRKADGSIAGFQGVDAALKDLEGATAITQLNSTQIFSGMAPAKFSLTMHFRAWSDPITEVEQPIAQLLDWALPQELSRTSLATNLAKGILPGNSLINALFPSRAPQILGFTFAKRSVLPVVIEAVSMPISTPQDKNGNQIAVAVGLQVSTLSAFDKTQWRAWKIGSNAGQP